MVPTKSRPFVAYYRCSTKRQQQSGLGLDAQRECVERLVRERGGRIVASYTEAESGRRTDRPELAKALGRCKAHGAVLIVARLDRLARNTAFLLSVLDAGVEVLACDMPGVDRFGFTVLAAVAEQESKSISERTRAALAQAKKRGARLGKPENLTEHARQQGPQFAAQARVDQANERARDLAPVVAEIRAEGAISLREIGAALDAREITTPRGSTWTAAGVARLLDRIGA